MSTPSSQTVARASAQTVAHASTQAGCATDAALGLSPSAGTLPLPALTVDLAAYRHNRDLFFALARAYGARVAPHAKTPMCPDIALDLIAAGADGASVANLQQADTLLDAGIGTVLIANQIGGAHNARRLRALSDAYPKARIACFADSVAAVSGLAAAFEGRENQPLSVYLEVGTGRTGARTLGEAGAVLDVICAAQGLTLAGVATYEGAVTGETPDAFEANMAALFALVSDAFALARKTAPNTDLTLSAGGSVHFDRVIAALSPLVQADGKASLLLRSGAIFFADHGVYERSFAALDGRGLLTFDGAPFEAGTQLKPAMRLWAEILSVPEPGLAIAAMGMRDVSYDQDLPIPLVLHRDGAVADGDLASRAKVTKLNDQHAFLSISGGEILRVGDVVAFGISHPCTCFDRWRSFYGLDADGRVERLYRTFFH